MGFTLTLLFVLLPAVFGNFLPPGLRARHDDNGKITFPALPQSVREALEMGWEECERAPVPRQYESLKAMCLKGDRSISGLFDCTGNIAGIHINLNQKYLINAIYDMEVEGFVNWSSTYNGELVNFWTTGMYFVEDASNVRIRPTNSMTFLQEENLYVSGFNGEIYKISTDLRKNTDFTLQRCVEDLGTNFFYKMNSKTECKADTIFPWYYFSDGSKLVGLAFYITGVLDGPKGSWTWLETCNRTAAEAALFDGPECLYDVGDVYGWTGFKVMMVDNPEDLTC